MDFAAFSAFWRTEGALLARGCPLPPEKVFREAQRIGDGSVGGVEGGGAPGPNGAITFDQFESVVVSMIESALHTTSDAATAPDAAHSLVQRIARLPSVIKPPETAHTPSPPRAVLGRRGAGVDATALRLRLQRRGNGEHGSSPESGRGVGDDGRYAPSESRGMPAVDRAWLSAVDHERWWAAHVRAGRGTSDRGTPERMASVGADVIVVGPLARALAAAQAASRSTGHAGGVGDGESSQGSSPPLSRTTTASSLAGGSGRDWDGADPSPRTRPDRKPPAMIQRAMSFRRANQDKVPRRGAQGLQRAIRWRTEAGPPLHTQPGVGDPRAARDEGWGFVRAADPLADPHPPAGSPTRSACGARAVRAAVLRRPRRQLRVMDGIRWVASVIEGDPPLADRRRAVRVVVCVRSPLY